MTVQAEKRFTGLQRKNWGWGKAEVQRHNQKSNRAAEEKETKNMAQGGKRCDKSYYIRHI